ncbi:DUF1559 domain-containing protein [Stieleria varia]|uniref:DUF1559 domain-containing protein n=1 Tax=Stieleria varia TaxID=2528005 RepID=A0A5C6AGC2_9BACT|nr:DUF1559 domain-containing protein [Stieleria varia]TWT98477.1 hypothetical protein Pla52n_49910 [Stieleria varia]
MRQTQPMRRPGFTVLEMFAVLLVITVLISLLLPAVQSSREAARRSSCQNNLLQVGMAVHLYHEAFDHYPVQLHGTDGNVTPGKDNDRRLSIFVGLLPFMDGNVLFESIQSELVENDFDEMDMWMGDPAAYNAEMRVDESEGYESVAESDSETKTQRKYFPAGGPEPFTQTYQPWMIETSPLRCPSDPGIGAPGLGRINYAACLGDGIVGCNTGPFVDRAGTWVFDSNMQRQCEASMRGIFVPRVVTRKSDVTDGLSHTILLGEIATDLGDQNRFTTPWFGASEAELCENPVRGDSNTEPERPMYWIDSPKLLTNTDSSWNRGMSWADGMPLHTSFQTIWPPNSPIVVTANSDTASGIFSASSRHLGGASVYFADGAIRFISDSINAGDATGSIVCIGSSNPPGSESPFGVWGALGTRSSNELKSFSLPDR